MRLKIRRDQNLHYIQLYDDDGHFYHIGLATLENFSLVAYVMGLNDAFKFYGRMKHYFVKRARGKSPARRQRATGPANSTSGNGASPFA